MAIGSCTGCKPGTLEAFNAYLKQVTENSTGRDKNTAGKAAEDVSAGTSQQEGINQPVAGAVVGGLINLRA